MENKPTTYDLKQSSITIKMSLVQEIKNKQDADNIFRSGYTVVIIDHYADWCQPCKYIQPHFEQLASQFSSNKVIFAKCNSELQLFAVSGLPTIEFYVNGNKVEEIRGADLERINNITKQLVNTPMNANQMSQIPLSGTSAPMLPSQPQSNTQQPPIGSFNNVAPPTTGNNPYSIGQFKTGTKGRGSSYSSYKKL